MIIFQSVKYLLVRTLTLRKKKEINSHTHVPTEPCPHIHVMSQSRVEMDRRWPLIITSTTCASIELALEKSTTICLLHNAKST